MFQKEIDNQYVFYPGYISKEWKIIEAHASGYVLLSLGERMYSCIYERPRRHTFTKRFTVGMGYKKINRYIFCKQEDGEIKPSFNSKNFIIKVENGSPSFYNIRGQK